MGCFACETCELSFADGHELMDHLSDEHPIEEWSEAARLPGEKEVAI